jgi:hypothetical protein
VSVIDANSACLSSAELVAITGYRQKVKQASYLRANKIAYTLNALGHPVVGRRYYEVRSGEQKRRSNSGPNWAAQEVTP